ncbi:hypothetical protein Pfo_000423 [Paulownia fortunei]|nr:hypothetical protein Pfo_000423 [Paulownia fortunei]
MHIYIGHDFPLILSQQDSSRTNINENVEQIIGEGDGGVLNVGVMGKVDTVEHCAEVYVEGLGERDSGELNVGVVGKVDIVEHCSKVHIERLGKGDGDELIVGVVGEADTIKHCAEATNVKGLGEGDGGELNMGVVGEVDTAEHCAEVHVEGLGEGDGGELNVGVVSEVDTTEHCAEMRKRSHVANQNIECTNDSIQNVVFVHKFSGWMDVEAMITISLSYLLSSATMIYNQHLMQAFPEPAIDLKYVGISMFLLGIGGNFYHHYLLSKLRTKGEKQYKIPQGGFFSLLICPHYLFEILGFFGISCISQTLYVFSFTMGTTFYLMGRSYATRKWYESKFEDFPKDVKALIPYIF